MLRQPILVDPDYPRRLEEELNQYVCHIFDQPLEKAYRRSRVYSPKNCDDLLARMVDSDTLTMGNLIKRIIQKILGINQRTRPFDRFDPYPSRKAG